MTLDRRSFFAAGAALSLLPVTAIAQEDAAEKRRREDWAWLGRYADENAALKASGDDVGIVFMGDSITEGWRGKRPDFFTNGRVCRGIGGQTTPQMVLRMIADVVALAPRAVHIMAGTNDIAGNTGSMTRQQSYDCIAAMTQIAQANGLDVILASVPPAASFPWRPGLETIGPIAEMNAWIEAFAAEAGATWVDYGPALGDGKGAIRPGLANDGVHPEVEGYVEMEQVIEPVLTAMRL